jgi:hypothetical protein
MRYSLVIFIVFFCTGTQVRAFSCDDFSDVFKANIEEGLGYQKEFNSKTSDEASQCHFVHDIFIPYTEKTIVIMNRFAQCPKYKDKVAIAVGKTQKDLETLKGLLPKECK